MFLVSIFANIFTIHRQGSFLHPLPRVRSEKFSVYFEYYVHPNLPRISPYFSPISL